MATYLSRFNIKKTINLFEHRIDKQCVHIRDFLQIVKSAWKINYIYRLKKVREKNR